MFGWDEEEHEDAVPHDRFDTSNWNQMRMESIAIEDIVNELSVKYPYVEDFTQDVFSTLSKSAPRVREPEEMKSSHVPLREVTSNLAGLPEVGKLREHTVGDPFNAAMALGSMRDVLEESLKRAAELEEQAKAAQQLADAAKEAAANGDPNAQGAADAASAAGEELVSMAASSAAAGRANVRRAAKEADGEIEQLEETVAAFGTDPADFKRMPFKERMALAKRLKSRKLAEFSKLIGQFRSLATAEYRRRVADGADEIVGLKRGNDMQRLAVQELASFATPELEDDFWLRFANGQLLINETRSRERIGKGPIVFVSDESGSMAGPGERWAKGLALALLDQATRGKRDFHYIGFASSGQMREFFFPKGAAPSMDRVLEMAEGFLDGGTSFQGPLRRALDIVQAAGTDRPDIVFVTDGHAERLSFIDEWRATRERLSVKCFAIVVDTAPTPVLLEIADNVRGVYDLLDVTQAADILRT